MLDERSALMRHAKGPGGGGRRTKHAKRLPSVTDARGVNCVASLEAEQQLVRQLRVLPELSQLVQARIGAAVNQGHVTATVMAWLVLDERFVDVPDTSELDSVSDTKGKALAISWDQLTLDLQPFVEEHKRVASVLLSLQRMKSPMHCVVSRQRLRWECKPSEQAPTLWGRLFGWTQEALYYRLVVDFSQTEPRHEIREMH